MQVFMPFSLGTTTGLIFANNMFLAILQKLCIFMSRMAVSQSLETEQESNTYEATGLHVLLFWKVENIIRTIAFGEWPHQT